MYSTNMYSAYTIYVCICVQSIYVLLAFPVLKEMKKCQWWVYILEGQERDGIEWARIAAVQSELELLTNKWYKVLWTCTPGVS